jgi:lipopolysaccharide transport system permease protein
MASDTTLNNSPSLAKTRRRKLIIQPPKFSFANLSRDLSKLVKYRDLLYTLSVHRIKVRYKQSILGVSWAIIQPLAMVLILTAIFSFVVRMPSEGLPYVLFVYVALLPWNFLSTSLTTATTGLVSHAHLITKVYFPREILPLTYVIAALFDFVIASTVLIALLAYHRVPLTANAIYVLPIITILTLFTIGVAFLLSALQVRFRDIGVAVPIALQVWMFASPVLYPLTAVPARLRSVYVLNPMVGIIEGLRSVVLHGALPDTAALSVSALMSVVLLIVSYTYFKRVESTMADVI